MKKINIIAVAIYFSLISVSSVNAIGPGDFEYVDIHGFISQGYLCTTDNNWMGASKDGTWQFNELGINFTTMLTNRLRLGMQFLARDLGTVGNDAIIIDWAYADYSITEWLGIRAGQMKNPIGIYNESRDIDFLRNSVFLPQVFYNEAARDSIYQNKGAGIYGTIDTGVLGMFHYLALYGITNMDEEGGTGRVLEDALINNLKYLIPPSMISLFQGGSLTNIEAEMTYMVNLEWYLPLDGLRLAGIFHRLDYNINYTLTFAGTIYPIDPFKVEQEIWAVSVEYAWHDLLLSVEYLQAYGQKQHGESWYAMASYRLLSWLALGAYYGEYYPDIDDKSGRSPMLAADYKAWLKIIAGFVRFDINDNWLVKGEYQYNDGVAMLYRSDNLNTMNQVDYTRFWHFFAIKVTFNF